MSPEYDEMLDKTIDAMIPSLLGIPKPSLTIDHDPEFAWKNLADKLVQTTWELPPDDDGEHGLIDELIVPEGDYAIDFTAAHDLGYELPDAGGTVWVYRDHAHPNDAEVRARCTLQAILGPKYTGDKWLAIYHVETA